MEGSGFQLGWAHPGEWLGGGHMSWGGAWMQLGCSEAFLLQAVDSAPQVALPFRTKWLGLGLYIHTLGKCVQPSQP